MIPIHSCTEKVLAFASQEKLTALGVAYQVKCHYDDLCKLNTLPTDGLIDIYKQMANAPFTTDFDWDESIIDNINKYKPSILMNDKVALEAKIAYMIMSTDLYRNHSKLPNKIKTWDLWCVRNASQLPKIDSNSKMFLINETTTQSDPTGERLMIISSKIWENKPDIAFVTIGLEDWRPFERSEHNLKQQRIRIIEVMANWVQTLLLTVSCDYWKQHKTYMNEIDSIYWALGVGPMKVNEADLILRKNWDD